MKQFKFLILVFAAVFSMYCASTSCSAQTVVTIETDDIYNVRPENVTYTTIVQFGTPVYYGNVISYYAYKGIFYYPYMWNNCMYFRPYRRVQPLGFVFVPTWKHIHYNYLRCPHNYIDPHVHKYHSTHNHTHYVHPQHHTPVHRPQSHHIAPKPSVNRNTNQYHRNPVTVQKQRPVQPQHRGNSRTNSNGSNRSGSRR